jgi:hypothetical protein
MGMYTAMILLAIEIPSPFPRFEPSSDFELQLQGIIEGIFEGKISFVRVFFIILIYEV